MTDTERNALFSAAILAGTVLFFAAVCAGELELGRWNPDIRLVFYPAETATRYLGVSHFLVALLFTATSRRMRAPAAWGRFGLLLGVGALLCLGYSKLNAASPVAAGVFFTAYFLAHDSRDEVFFYCANGDAPPEARKKPLAAALAWTPFLLIGAAAVVLAAAAVGGVYRPEALAAAGLLPAGLRWAAVAALAAVLFAALFAWKRRCERAAREKLAALLAANRPILAVFAGSSVILVGGLFLGLQAYSIVILHVAAWYVFSLHQMRKQPAPAAPLTGWAWLRATPAGFNLLHLGSAALLLGAGAVWAYQFRNSAGIRPLWVLLDRQNFAYWTILHVTVSFGR